jgi:transposase
MSTTPLSWDGHLGIDIAAQTFDVALAVGGREVEAHFANDPDGFAALSRWLAGRGARRVRATMEATGRYGEALADYLHQAGHGVAVVNPARIAAYGQSRLRRAKTDRLDAKLILHFGQREQPALWTPPAPEMRELREVLRRLADLQAQQQQERNRLAAGNHSALVLADIRDNLAGLQARSERLKTAIAAHVRAHPALSDQERLLCSITGIGPLTAERLMAELPDIRHFTSPKQLVAYAGLAPNVHESGRSVRRRPGVSRQGHAQLRAWIFMPALVAIRHNPVMAAYYHRLCAAGKPKMVAVVAVMRKLLHIVFGVLKSKRPFDPAFGLLSA